jgi:ribosome-associated protein
MIANGFTTPRSRPMSPQRGRSHHRSESSDPEAARSDDDADAAPSKTKRKATMHALQDLGEALVDLDPRRMAELTSAVALPEQLVDAIVAARSITAWGGRKRQLQYIGKLMREVDPEPIRHRLDAWAHGHREDTARQHALEQWRDRLINESDALELLAADHPALDRAKFHALIARARSERDSGGPPHAYRELFRMLKGIEALK